jgi:hypothetical protein
MNVLLGATCVASILGVLPLPADTATPREERDERRQAAVLSVGDDVRVEGELYTLTRGCDRALVLVPFGEPPTAERGRAEPSAVPNWRPLPWHPMVGMVCQPR